MCIITFVYRVDGSNFKDSRLFTLNLEPTTKLFQWQVFLNINQINHSWPIPCVSGLPFDYFPIHSLRGPVDSNPIYKQVFFGLDERWNFFRAEISRSG